MTKKQKELLEIIENKLQNLNVREILNYEKYSGPGLKKKIKRLIFSPRVCIRNKFREFIKFIKNKNKENVMKFSNNLEILKNFLSNFDSINELKTIKFFIKNLNHNDIFYDIGAEKGVYTSLAIELCKEVHSFEPMPEFFEILKMQFGNYSNVFLNNLALSNKKGKAKLSKNPTSIVDEIKTLYKTKSVEIEVETLTLDEYIKNHSVPTAIKMDVEGAEYLILEGGEMLFRNYTPIIAMEVLGDEFLANSLKAINLLQKFGYKPFEILLDGSIKEISYSQFYKAKGICNYVFKK